MRLGILGGTFDPVHYGHLVLAEEAREQLELERVLFVPAGQPWRKAGRPVSPASHRLAMLRLAIEDNPAFEVAELELVRPGPSYSAETLAQVQKENPAGELYFIVGLDAWEDMPNWHEPERIVELATVVLAGRATLAGTPTPEREITGLRENVHLLENRSIEISGTDIRQRVARGRSIRYLVPEAVRSYIADNGLYAD